MSQLYKLNSIIQLFAPINFYFVHFVSQKWAVSCLEYFSATCRGGGVHNPVHCWYFGECCRYICSCTITSGQRILWSRSLIILFMFKSQNPGQKKTSTSYHIMHLAVADSLLLLTLPFNADSRLNNGLWRFGSFGCKFRYPRFTWFSLSASLGPYWKANESMKMVNFFQSILLIGICLNIGLTFCLNNSWKKQPKALMAIDRYMTVMSRKNRSRKPLFSNIICLIVWITSVLMVSPIINYTSIQVRGHKAGIICCSCCIYVVSL